MAWTRVSAMSVAFAFCLGLVSGPAAYAGYGWGYMAPGTLSCSGGPTPDLPSYSAVAGASGGLVLDYGISGVAGVPGFPFGLILHHDSSLDDPGTHGAYLRFETRQQLGHLVHPSHIDSGYVWLDANDDGVSMTCDAGSEMVAFGHPELQGDGEICHPYLPAETKISLGNAFLSHHEVPAWACNTIGGTDTGGDYLVSTYSVRIRLNGTQATTRHSMCSGGCPAQPDVLPALGPELYRVMAKVGAMFTSDVGEPPARSWYKTPYYSWGCERAGHELFFYLEPHAREDVSRMGRNWSHNYGDYVTRHERRVAPGDNKRKYVVFHPYTGGWLVFNDSPSDFVELDGAQELLHPSPEGEGCTSCRPWQLYKTSRGYEQVFKDGSRRVFDKDRGFLLTSIEERNLSGLAPYPGINATTLDWGDSAAGGLQLNSVRDAAGNVYGFEYDPGSHLLAWVVLPGVRVWTLGYEVMGNFPNVPFRLVELEDPEQSATSQPGVRFAYGLGSQDAFDIVARTDPDGVQVSYEYEPEVADPNADTGKAGRLVKATLGSGPSARSITYGYSDQQKEQRLATASPPDPLNAPILRVEYDASGRRTRVERDADTTWVCPPYCDPQLNIERDLSGRVVKVSEQVALQEPPGPDTARTTCFRYVDGNLVKTEGPLCLSGWDCDVLEHACQAGPELEWESTPYTRVRSILPPSEQSGGGKKYLFSYDDTPAGNGNLSTVLYPEHDPANPTPDERYFYDPSTYRVTRFEDGAGEAWTLTWDPVTLLLSAEGDPLGYSTEYSYDPSTLLLTDAYRTGGVNTKITRNARGDVRFVSRPNDYGIGDSVEYRYGPGGELAEVLDLHRCTAWKFVRDPETGLVTEVRRALYGVDSWPSSPCAGGSPLEEATYESRSYTPNLAIGSVTLRDGSQVLFDYDGQGFLASKDLCPARPGLEEIYLYNWLDGTLAQVEFQSAEGESLCASSNPATIVERFRFDALNRPLREELDRAGLLADVRTDYFHDDAQNFWTATTWWEPAGPGTLLGAVRHDHDANGRPELLSLTARRSGVPVAAEYALEYDDAGRLATLADSTHNSIRRYIYRENGQLRRMEEDVPGDGDGATDLTYDGAARLWKATFTGPPIRGTDEYEHLYDPNGQLLRWKWWNTLPGLPQVLAGDLEYGYDRSYNRTSVTDHLASTTELTPVDWLDRITAAGFAYDTSGNMTSDGSECREFDARNRLVAADPSCGQDPSQRTEYAYDPFGRMLASQTGTQGMRFPVYLGWTLLHEVRLGLGAERSYGVGPGGVILGDWDAAGAYANYGSSVQGSRQLEGTGIPVYEPFGRMVGGGTLPSSIGFQGQEWRAEAGLYHMRHRWYHQGLGRFVSPDPVLGATVNNYTFVGNDPVHFSDPSGLYASIIIIGPGDGALEAFGHAALYLSNPQTGWVGGMSIGGLRDNRPRINEDYGDPLFREEVLSYYRVRRGRTVSEIVLDLNSEQERCLQEAIIDQLKFNDLDIMTPFGNCTTSVCEVLNSVPGVSVPPMLGPGQLEVEMRLSELIQDSPFLQGVTIGAGHRPAFIPIRSIVDHDYGSVK